LERIFTHENTYHTINNSEELPFLEGNGLTLSYLLATRFPGKVIPDCVRAIFNSETGELKGVVYHPRGERSGFVAARVNPGWYDIRMGIYIEIPEDYLASALVIDHYLSSDPVQKCFSDGQSRFSVSHSC
jgi:hypothetical protein